MERVIITGVDGSDLGRAAAGWAAREALRRRLPLRVVQVTPEGSPELSRSAEGDASGSPADRSVAELAGRHPSLTVRSVRLPGAAAAVLRTLTDHAELLVVGLDNTGGGAGTTAALVTAVCSCPVVLVPAPDRPGRTGPVIVGVDVRDPSDGPLGFAFETARRRRAPLHAVYASAKARDASQAADRPPSGPEGGPGGAADPESGLVHEVLDPWRERYPDVAVTADVVPLPPAEALARASHSAALVVVGRGTGATAHNLLGRAECPVAVVP
ncbi:universal stress protein [Streptomyces sp. YIM S03343]